MIVLHAGPHKTATTYIQHNLFNLRQDLLARGWHYPDVGLAGSTGHHDLAHNPAQYLEEDGAEAAAMATLARKASGKNIVFSAEGFCRWNRARLTKLAKALNEPAFEIVYVLRHPIDTFHSYWAEEVKQGYSASLTDAFARDFADPQSSRLLNPLIDIGKLSLYPEARIRVIPYEVLRSRKIDIFSHFAETVLGLKGLQPASNASRNVAFPIELTEFLRLMTIVAGQGARRLADGSAMRLRFTSKTSEQYRQSLVDLMLREAGEARRSIDFPARPFFLASLGRKVSASLAGKWTMDFAPQELYGAPRERSLVHYDDQLLMRMPKVLEACHETLEKIGFTGADK